MRNTGTSTVALTTQRKLEVSLRGIDTMSVGGNSTQLFCIPSEKCSTLKGNIFESKFFGEQILSEGALNAVKQTGSCLP